MDKKQITQTLMENLKQVEAKTQNYIQGYADAIGEAIYIIEKDVAGVDTKSKQE